MLKVLISLLLVFQCFASEEIEVGYVYGTHLRKANKDANNSHIYSRIDIYQDIGVIYFRNSIDRDSFGLTKRFSFKIEKGKQFFLDTGFVSGYNKKHIKDSLWIDNELVFIIAPTFNFEVNKSLDLRIISLGDSINTGIIIKF